MLENLPSSDEGDANTLVQGPVLRATGLLHKQHYFTKHMWAIIQILVPSANCLSLSIYKAMCKLPIHSWYLIWFPALKCEKQWQNFFSSWWLFNHKANVFEIKWNWCLILSHRHPETGLKEEKFQYVYSLWTYLWQPLIFWHSEIFNFKWHGTTNLCPTEFKAQTKLLTSLASFYELKTLQNNSDYSYQCKKEATQLGFFFNSQIKIIIRKKDFQRGRFKSKVSENLEPQINRVTSSGIIILQRK